MSDDQQQQQQLLEEQQQYQDQEIQQGIKGEDGEEYGDGFPEGYAHPGFVIREQDRWLPIANGKYSFVIYI